MGKDIYVDLSRKETTVEKPHEDLLRKFIGGLNLAIKILYDEVEPGINPLGPENRLIFVTSPLVGTLTPAACQYSVVAKSPLTGFIGFGRSKGFFAPELKFAGYDNIVVKGRADDPLYLWIHDNDVEFRSASHLWGKDTYETEELIRKELGDTKIKVACIGQAGESLSLMALIMNDKGHAAARCGIGAVMGSKKLKAIAVRGSKKVPVVDNDKLLALRKEWHRISKENKTAIDMSEYGTAGTYDRTEVRHLAGDLPTKNWTTTLFPEWRNLSGQHMKEKYPTRKTACFNCHIGHDYEIDIPSGPFAGSYVYPEYECTVAFGSNIGNPNTESMIKLTDIANRYGMDSIECSHTISMVMEGYEKNIIKREDLDGLELTWGNAEAVIQLMDKIVKREGIGSILADGVKRAADMLGTPNLAIHTKKMSPILHDLRHNWGWLINYTVGPAGPTHQGYAAMKDAEVMPEPLPPHSPRKKGETAKRGQIKWFGWDCLGVCRHAVYGVPTSLLLEFLSAVTGWKIDFEEFSRIIERGITLSRAFNIRNGLTPADDWPSERQLEPPPDGPAKGITAKTMLRGMIDEYYEHMGWDPVTGKPWKGTLNDLGLEEVAKDLWS